MRLKYPNSDTPFVVTPAYFIGDFDIYDREETLGVRLEGFNPNDEDQLRQLLDEFFFKGARVTGLSAEHKVELTQVLANALEFDGFDFVALVAHDRDPDDYFTLPESWDIQEPRLLFERIYNIALEYWARDFEVIGINFSPLRM